MRVVSCKVVVKTFTCLHVLCAHSLSADFEIFACDSLIVVFSALLYWNRNKFLKNTNKPEQKRFVTFFAQKY